MLLYIIRQGDPDYTTDTLTEKGVVQAEAVAKRLAAAKIDRVYSSTMGRALQTAAPTCRLLGLKCIPQDWAREIGQEMHTDYPDGKRRTMGQVPPACFWEAGSEKLPVDDFMQSPPFRGTGMDKKLREVAENAYDFLETLGYKKEGDNYRILRNNEEKVALFCHAGFARALCSVLLRIPPHIMWASFNYGHTGVTILEFHNSKSGITAPRCMCYSDMSHLFADGLEIQYNNRVPL